MDLSKVGYEHGWYHQTCCDCGREHTAGKRSWRCKPCAELVRENVLHPKHKYYPKYDRPADYATATLTSYHCGECGWPVIHTCVNGAMAGMEPYDEWDWWKYCSNKACEHHEGEGVFQETPDWVVINTVKKE